jgi:hypothetical protein
MDAGCYVRGESEYVSPSFFVVKPKKADNLKRYFEKLHSLRHNAMNEIILESDEHFLESLLNSELGERVVTDPHSRPKQIISRIEIAKKTYKTVLGFRYGLGFLGGSIIQSITPLPRLWKSESVQD